MPTGNLLGPNLAGKSVDQNIYRSMIGSLLYLTTTRPDIMFATCFCARFQANPKESHLAAVKRILRYLKGTPEMGLWYPKDSSFELISFTDSDYGGCKLDRKSTSGSCQFLGDKLTQLLDYGYKLKRVPIYCDSESAIAITSNPVQHSKTKHIDIRYHFIKDNVEKELESGITKRLRKTAYELIRGRKPNIEYFHIFGCNCYIKKDRDVLGKFDAKADDGFLVPENEAPDINIPAARTPSPIPDGFEEIPEIPAPTTSQEDIPSTSGSSEAAPLVAGSPQLDAVAEESSSTVAVEPLQAVPQLPALRWSRDHPIDQVLGDPSTGVRTRHQANNHYLFVCVLSENEPSKVEDALADPFWVSAMQEELAELEAIRLFLAYAAHMKFQVFQMDIKSAFLNGKLTEEIYVAQPSGYTDPKQPSHVYRLNKALCGLKQAPRAWYETLSTYLIQEAKHCKKFEALMQAEFKMSMMGELTYFLGLQVKQSEKGIFISQGKYVREMLAKFQLTTCCAMKTPMEPPVKVDKDSEGKPVDVTLYRGMIGSLLYLTASRLDIMYATCLYVRYEADPKESHMKVVKRIFRYLKGTPNLGLWYPRDSGFDLTAFSDSDFARCKIDRKSTTGGCQLLGGKLKTKHIEIQYHFIRDHVMNGDVELHFVPTEYQLADLFTKPLDEKRFNQLNSELGMLNPNV
ncbi:hypothetical protein OSB04_025332 [Centaurea solstitialis]|uniref:Reverse transcriptase Ty1/copia-type domain-containing protein n=1 Tax=Centaurea solstitialis TaxID=347529 RepID=A0AA38SMW4_9ASTR|nr:hypothetical protein OSB04_025332 [Centaurea solstitialis]